MSKSIGAQLLADIQKSVTTLATCIEITRKDGKTYRLTNHDTSITFQSQTYDHTIPFNISAIDSGSNLAIDNMTLTLFADGVTFISNEFRDGLFDYSEVTVFLVDYENPTHGRMIARRGWFGKIERNTRNFVEITITGLLKVFDFEVGRTYQPGCDADFGDSRCKVAVNQSQAYSLRNIYRAGDWIYYYDPLLMNAVTLVNPSFEADGSRSESNSITGWTKGTGAAFFVNQTPNSPNFGIIAANPDAADGTYALFASDDATDDDSGFENFIYQDVDLTGAGIAGADIDDGKISMKYTVALSTNIYTLDPLKIRVELYDANGDFVSNFDSGWQFLDTLETWRDRSLVFPVYPGARTLRMYIFMRKEDGAIANCGADDVKLWWWDHTLGTPYDGVVHRLSRLVSYSDDIARKPQNPSFEANGYVSNANNPTIRNWTTSGWWQVDDSCGAFTPTHGDLFLVGGNDGSSVAKTYTIEQTVNRTALFRFDTARLTAGKYVCRFRASAFFADAGLTKATIQLDVKDAANVVLETYYLYNNEAPGAVGTDEPYVDFALPPTFSKFTLTLKVHTPTGSGNGNKVAFDNFRFWFNDAERPVKTDPVYTSGSPTTAWDTTPTSYTLDGGLVWKAMNAFLNYDVVASVTSRKEFVATAMAGTSGTYETGIIWWISGNNAGLKNIIRTWNSGTKAVKLYFQEPYAIQAGDRFIYIRSCQKRFGEDCRDLFENWINFRGFPYIPGRLVTEEEATDSDTDNPDNS